MQKEKSKWFPKKDKRKESKNKSKIFFKKEKKKMKKPMKKLVKDTSYFVGGSMIIGAGSVATASIGGNTLGMAALGTGMRAVAPLIPMKASIGMLGSTMKTFKPKKRRGKIL